MMDGGVFVYGSLESSKLETLALKYIMDFSPCRLDNHRQRFWPSAGSSGWHLLNVHQRLDKSILKLGDFPIQ
jgi:hypothetical protein